MGSNQIEISLDNLTPLQRRLQLKFLECRRHNGNCRCYLTGETPAAPICSKPAKRYSRSWVKDRESNGQKRPELTCEVRENKCCPPTN